MTRADWDAVHEAVAALNAVSLTGQFHPIGDSHFRRNTARRAAQIVGLRPLQNINFEYTRPGDNMEFLMPRFYAVLSRSDGCYEEATSEAP